MAHNPQMSCRVHPATGRMTCTYGTGGRRPSGGPSTPSDQGAERSRRESIRRARRVVDEIVHDYDLRWMLTLTYADEPENLPEVFSTISAFSRRLRTAGLTAPRLIVPEYGSSTRTHLHMAVSVPLATERTASLWGHGAVHGPNADRAMSEGALDSLSRYITKGFDSTAKGSRRYITSAGLRPVEDRFTAPNADAALGIAARRFGAEPFHAAWYGGSYLALFNPILAVRAA